MRDVRLDDARDLLEAAELATGVVRTLRRLGPGATVGPDQLKVLENASRFLDDAAAGGAVLAGTASRTGAFSGRLDRLSWATEGYQRLRQASERSKVDYGEVAAYLTRIADSLRAATRQRAAWTTERAEESRAFFEHLADGLLRHIDATDRPPERRSAPQCAE